MQSSEPGHPLSVDTMATFLDEGGREIIVSRERFGTIKSHPILRSIEQAQELKHRIRTKSEHRTNQR